MVQKEEKVSFIRLDNANMVKITFGNLAKKFARYSQLMIDIKKLSDKKSTQRIKLIQNIKDLDKKFKEFSNILPKAPAAKKVVRSIEKYEPGEKNEEVENELGTFEDLREEFERLRGQLEEIKKTI